MIGVGRARVMTAMRDSRAIRSMESSRATYSLIWRRERKGMWNAMLRYFASAPACDKWGYRVMSCGVWMLIGDVAEELLLVSRRSQLQIPADHFFSMEGTGSMRR